MDVRKRDLLRRMTQKENGQVGQSEFLLPSEKPVQFVKYPIARRRDDMLNGSFVKNNEVSEK